MDKYASVFLHYISILEFVCISNVASFIEQEGLKIFIKKLFHSMKKKRAIESGMKCIEIELNLIKEN